MSSWLNRKKLRVNIEVEKSNVNVPRVVYRDDLTKKKSAVKKSVRFADSTPIILGEEKKEDFRKPCSETENEKGGGKIRVKVRMTKQEAARLLSKCKEGGVLELKDMARELVFMSVDPVSLESTCTTEICY